LAIDVSTEKAKRWQGGNAKWRLAKKGLDNKRLHEAIKRRKRADALPSKKQKGKYAIKKNKKGNRKCWGTPEKEV